MQGRAGRQWTDREELRRLIDVIEKASGSGQRGAGHVQDIKTFAHTASFLANKLEMQGSRAKMLRA